MVVSLIPSGRAVVTNEQAYLVNYEGHLNYIRDYIKQPQYSSYHYLLVSRFYDNGSPEYVQYVLFLFPRSSDIYSYSRYIHVTSVGSGVDDLIYRVNFSFFDYDSLWDHSPSYQYSGLTSFDSVSEVEFRFPDDAINPWGYVHSLTVLTPTLIVNGNSTSYTHINRMCWSDLPFFVDLVHREEVLYDHAQTVILASFVLFAVFRSLWRSIRGRDT